MQLLPYNELYIRTHLLHSDLVKKLKLITDSSTYLIQPLFNKKMYYGQVTTDGFKIHRRVSRHGSFSYGRGHSVHYMIFPPTITSEFLDAKDGEVVVKMRFHLHLSSIISFIIWITLYVLISLVFIFAPLTYLYRHISENFILGVFLVTILLIPSLTYATMLDSFKHNVKHEKEYSLKTNRSLRGH